MKANWIILNFNIHSLNLNYTMCSGAWRGLHSVSQLKVLLARYAWICSFRMKNTTVMKKYVIWSHFSFCCHAQISWSNPMRGDRLKSDYITPRKAIKYQWPADQIEAFIVSSSSASLEINFVNLIELLYNSLWSQSNLSALAIADVMIDQTLWIYHDFWIWSCKFDWITLVSQVKILHNWCSEIDWVTSLIKQWRAC